MKNYKLMFMLVGLMMGSVVQASDENLPTVTKSEISQAAVEIASYVKKNISQVFNNTSLEEVTEKEVTPVKQGNSWYFNTLEVLNLNSDDAKIEMAKVELGAEKVAAIEADSMGSDKASQAFLKKYNKMHPATFTDMQKMTGAGLFVTSVAGFIAYKYFYGSDADSTEEIDKN